jgi:transposase
MSREAHVRFWESAVVKSRRATHLPLYRQAQIYARQGVNLDRSTLADWVGRAAWHLRPVYERLLEHIRSSPKIFADETTAPVLDPGRGRTKTGQLWTYVRDDRPWGGADPPAVAYVYAPDRKGERPVAHLAGFAGVLQVDGYAGYRQIAGGNRVQLAFCWAHVRRRFYELAAAGQMPDQRCAGRREQSQPIIDALQPWLREKLSLLSQKTKLAEATGANWKYSASRSRETLLCKH